MLRLPFLMGLLQVIIAARPEGAGAHCSRGRPKQRGAVCAHGHIEQRKKEVVSVDIHVARRAHVGDFGVDNISIGDTNIESEHSRGHDDNRGQCIVTCRREGRCGGPAAEGAAAGRGVNAA